MALFVAGEKGIEIMGINVLAPLEGMGAFRSMAEGYLAAAGLGNVVPDETHWYSLQSYLDAFKIITAKTGDSTLRNIGKHVMSSAALPPMNSIEDALGLMDIAYHMNYRNAKGQVLFDPKRTPAMLEGIGHYKCEHKPGERKAFMVVNGPYPCPYDLGIITEFAKHYSRTAQVQHDNSFGCRKDGKDACRYIVTW